MGEEARKKKEAEEKKAGREKKKQQQMELKLLDVEVQHKKQRDEVKNKDRQLKESLLVIRNKDQEIARIQADFAHRYKRKNQQLKDFHKTMSLKDVEIGKYQNRCSEMETKLADMVLQVNLGKMDSDKLKERLREHEDREKEFAAQSKVLEEKIASLEKEKDEMEKERETWRGKRSGKIQGSSSSDDDDEGSQESSKKKKASIDEKRIAEIHN